ncbi:hypothetical protein EMCRGX_G022113 [Ephydatia muelleri]
MSETAVQLFSRLGAKESLGDAGLHMFSHISGGLLPSDVVEFSGAEGTGKTELLLNIVAYCTLPKVVGSNMSLGKEVDVVYVCTDYKLDLLRLVTVLEAKLNVAYSNGGASCASTVKEAVKSCLSRTHTMWQASTGWTGHDCLSLPIDLHWNSKPLLMGRSDEALHSTKSCSSDDFMCRQWRQLVKYRFLLQKAEKLLGNTQTDAVFRCTPLPPLHTSQPHTACYTFNIKESGVHFLP